jgi:hypothetical protein
MAQPISPEYPARIEALYGTTAILEAPIDKLRELKNLTKYEIGWSIRRTGFAIALVSLITMAIDNVTTGTIAERVHPQPTNYQQKLDSEKIIKESEGALKRISAYVPEEVQTSLRATVETSPQVAGAKQIISQYDSLRAESSSYASELRGIREGVETAGFFGGIITAVAGNLIAGARRRLVTSKIGD